MNVFIMDPIAASVVAQLSQVHQVIDYPRSREEDWHANADAIIVRTFEVGADDFRQAKRLKIVSKHGAGVDNIDIESAGEAGVVVTYTPGANAAAVAEYALAITLALARKVTIANDAVRQPTLGAIPAGIEIGGKTVGVLGFGETGRRTARLFKSAFDVELLVYDPFASDAALAELNAVRVDSIEALLPKCDVISIHLPLLEETRNLISTREFALMRDSALLINVARGGIVDEDALYRALVDGEIAGAASDVFVSEPVKSSHPLLSLPGFIASPHIAASTRESLIRMGTTAAQAVIDVLAGRTPAYPLRTQSELLPITA